MSVDRISRISEEVKKELGRILQNEIKDPRLPGMTSVVAANVTRDLRYAKVYISVLGTEVEKTNALLALKSASGYIRREIGRRVQLRYTPELIFELDHSIEYGAHINQLIHQVSREHHNEDGSEAKPDQPERKD